MLLEAQNDLLKRINNPVRGDKGLKVQLQDIESKLRCVSTVQESKERDEAQNGSNDESSTVDVSRRDSVSDEDLRDMFKLLKKQKEGLDILTSSVNDSTRQLMVMEREIDLELLQP